VRLSGAEAVYLNQAMVKMFWFKAWQGRRPVFFSDGCLSLAHEVQVAPSQSPPNLRFAALPSGKPTPELPGVSTIQKRCSQGLNGPDRKLKRKIDACLLKQ